jgi:hypothetical protein
METLHVVSECERDCCLFQLIFNTCACTTSTAVLTVGHFWRHFQQQLERLRLITVNRDGTRPNETFIYTITLLKYYGREEHFSNEEKIWMLCCDKN